MRVKAILACAALLAVAHSDHAAAQVTATSDLRIVWEVKNRFRLFRNETDFLRQVAASRGDGVLAAERRLARESDGFGWAKDVVGHLCVDAAGTLLETCERDGEKENYLAPRDHRVGVTLGGTLPPGAICAWTFDDGQTALRQVNVPCEEEIKLRLPYRRSTVATVDIPLGDGTAQRIVRELAVRDVLIAGIGDSIAAGEGNPDKAVALEGGFCFRRFLGGGGSQYFRPGRAGFGGDRACEIAPSGSSAAADWARHAAQWMSPACHRSLYSYQVRTALALAIENPHLAVTFIPLACTGATIDSGLFGDQQADECPAAESGSACSGSVPGQLGSLRTILATARRQQPDRKLDLVFLTIGANDVKFSPLVANVIVEATTERLLLRSGGAIASPEDSEHLLNDALPDDFTRLRATLKPIVGGNLSRVVYVSYGNPAMQSATAPCPGGRDGFDVHPAFGMDRDRLSKAIAFVGTKFLPKVRALATCDGKNACRDPMTDRMSFVDSHQADFVHHGVCARAADDPEFDRACFSPKGDSFSTDPSAADDPMACSFEASDFRPYASRARWIRTANDSYFAAMTYPEALPSTLRPSDIHDATWGVLSAVYGGALHPTAEGLAAMADAALPVARQMLDLPTPAAIRAEPLPPPPTQPAGTP
jgi:hypothetical protein